MWTQHLKFFIDVIPIQMLEKRSWIQHWFSQDAKWPVLYFWFHDSEYPDAFSQSDCGLTDTIKYKNPVSSVQKGALENTEWLIVYIRKSKHKKWRFLCTYSAWYTKLTEWSPCGGCRRTMLFNNMGVTCKIYPSWVIGGIPAVLLIYTIISA